MKHTLVDQNVEYYHVHHCACGTEVFHDGATATCEDAYFETFRCAGCKPCPYGELLTRGQVPSVRSQHLLGSIFLLAVGWACGVISCVTLWLIIR